MRWLFLGAGAIGTYVGGSLAALGEDVTFIEQPAAAEAIRAQGLVLHNAAGTRQVRDFTIHDSATDALAAGPYDVGVFALKSFDTATAVDQLVATGQPVPPILSLQNGVDNERAIADRLGSGSVITGTVTTAVGKPGLGEVVEEKRRGMGSPWGTPCRSGSWRPSTPPGWPRGHSQGRADEMVEAADQPHRQRDLGDPGPAGGCPVRRPAVVRGRGGCAARVPRGDEGPRVPPVDLPGTPVRLLGFAAQRLPRFIAQPALTRALGSGRGDKMPSFHIDLHAGRGKSEVAWLNGAVARIGAEHGVDAPINRVLTQVLEALTDGSESIEDYRGKPQALLARLGRPN